MNYKIMVWKGIKSAFFASLGVFVATLTLSLEGLKDALAGQEKTIIVIVISLLTMLSNWLKNKNA